MESWAYSNGAFGLVFSGIFGIYSDKTRMPEMWNVLRSQIGDYLHYYWPGRFPDTWRGIEYYFSFDDFPRSEQVELLRAGEAMLRDLIDDKLDPRLGQTPKFRVYGIDALHEFVRLAKQDLAAADRN